MYYLGIDLGGTNIAVGIVNEACEIIAKATSSTATDNAEQIADAMAATARFGKGRGHFGGCAVDRTGISRHGEQGHWHHRVCQQSALPEHSHAEDAVRASGRQACLHGK